MTWNRAAIACAAAVLLLAAGSSAAQTRVAASAGLTTAYNQTYFSLGAHLGRMLAGGVEPNVEATWWIGPSPTVLKLAPGVDWYIPMERLRPYIGAYYARWLVGSGFEDRNGLGARFGLLFPTAGRAYFSVGASYEHVLSCDRNCDSWTPQATVGTTF